jgi:hypothetical protein
MKSLYEALFTMINSIVVSATGESEGGAVRMVRAIKGSFDPVIKIADKLSELLGGLGA